jgi:hypothetical protein
MKASMGLTKPSSGDLSGSSLDTSHCHASGAPIDPLLLCKIAKLSRHEKFPSLVRMGTVTGISYNTL